MKRNQVRGGLGGEVTIRVGGFGGEVGPEAPFGYEVLKKGT